MDHLEDGEERWTWGLSNILLSCKFNIMKIPLTVSAALEVRARVDGSSDEWEEIWTQEMELMVHCYNYHLLPFLSEIIHLSKNGIE